MMQEDASPQDDQPLSTLFCAMDIPESLKKGISELGYVSPTAFQNGVYELFRKGRNVACLGPSNYGKSLAYNLPILAKLNPEHKVPQALIICDNATQSEISAKECRALSRHLNIKVDLGSNLEADSSSWPQVLICSTSDIERLLDAIVAQGTITTIFLDNLSAHHAPRIINILATLLMGGEVQILIFGNDTINAIKEQAGHVLDNVAFLNNGDQPKVATPAKHIAHITKETEPKPRALLAALEIHKPKNALITCNEAHECELLARFLSRYGFKTSSASEESNRQSLSENLNILAQDAVHVFICQNSLLTQADLSGVRFMINYDMIERPQLYEQITQFNKQAPGLERHIVNLVASRELGYLGPIKAQCLVDISMQDLPSGDEVLALSARRVMTELNAEASLVELGQFEALAQKIFEQPEAQPAFALLLRNHFLKPHTQAEVRPAQERKRFERPDRRERVPRERQGQNNDIRSSDRQPSDDQPAPRNISSSPEGSTRLYVTLGRQDGLADLASLAQLLSDRSGVDLGHFSGSGMVRDHSAHIEVDDEVAEDIIRAIHNSERQPGAVPAETPNLIVCERARQMTERTHRRPPMRRGGNFQRRR